MSEGFSEYTFKEKALQLLSISEKLNDTWKIHEKDGKTYFTKKQIVSIESLEVPSELFSVEYHVAFHPTYQVPVLYFNAHRDNGCLISLEDVSKLFVDDCKNEIYKIISQADHPVLFRPFYMIHPCHIHEVLSKFPESKNFVLTFLTVFGPSVRLKMSEEYEKFFK